MVERIRDLIERFPEDEKWVSELIKSDSRFDSLCQAYKEVSVALHRVERESAPNVASKVEELKRRRVALEEEILTKMEGYKPI